MTCPAIAPAHFSQAGARCEREPHGPDVNHKVAPTADKPGAVWSTRTVLVLEGTTEIADVDKFSLVCDEPEAQKASAPS